MFTLMYYIILPHRSSLKSCGNKFQSENSVFHECGARFFLAPYLDNKLSAKIEGDEWIA